MGVAIITGASSGLGRAYAKEIDKNYPEIDEFWLIARRVDHMRALASELKGKRVETLPLDLADSDSYDLYNALLKARRPVVRLLVNCAGFGKLNYFEEVAGAIQRDMINVNCTALTVITQLTSPYMQSGGAVINISSIAAFAPAPRMSVYGATKSYVMSFSKALRMEWKPRRVNVLAVCPGPMDTEFLNVAGIAGRSKAFARLPRVSVDRMAALSLSRALQGRAVYTGHPLYRVYRALAKLLTDNLLMRFTRL
jgi:short-subunit dehydrogenase